MISFTASPAEVSQLYSLIQVVSDPALVKTALDQLQTAQTNLAAEQAANQKILDDARTVLADTEKAKVDAQAVKDAADLANGITADQLKQKLALAVADADAYSKASSDLAIKTAAFVVTVDTKTKELTQREADVSAREAALVTSETAVDALKSDYEQKVATLKSALT